MRARGRHVLSPARARGQILGFTVRCDAETNHGADPRHPVVAIEIRPRARSVAQFVLRSGQR